MVQMLAFTHQLERVRLTLNTAHVSHKCVDRFHDRTFDVGIAEQHAVTFAAGLACEGLRPFCAIYSTFLQRGYDQIIHDVALQKPARCVCFSSNSHVS